MTDACAPHDLTFGEFRLDLRDERLFGPGGQVALGNKAIRVLARLAAEPHVLVTKDMLFDTVWPGTIVTESALTSVIKELRRALVDPPREPRFIESVYGRGYRFVAEVRRTPRADPAPDAVQSLPASASPRGGPNLDRRALVGGAAVMGGAAVVSVATWFGGRGSDAGDPSIAIIPFDALDGQSRRYFSSGLSDEIGVELASVQGLRVIAPSSVDFAVGKGGPPADVARRLGVRFLLTGSVQRQGDVVRIICTLVDTQTGATAWTDRFNRPADDVFGAQRDIARQVAGIVSVEAGSVRPDTLPSIAGGTRNAAAHDAYLKGLSLTEQGAGQAAYTAATRQFRTALDLDPGFALARAQLAMAHVATALYFGGTPTMVASHLDSAVALARQAVAQAPASALAQSVLGYVLIVARFDFAAARPFIERGRQLGAGLAFNQSSYALFAAQCGRVDDARKAIARALELDPLNPARRRIAVQIALLNRDYVAAADYAAKALALSPRISLVNGYLGDTLIMLRRFADARDAYRAESVEVLSWTGLAIAQFHLGDLVDARRWRERVDGDFGTSASYQQAQIWSQWRDPDRAGEALKSAWAVADTGLTVLFRDPLLDPIRTLPIYGDLVRRMRFV